MSVGGVDGARRALRKIRNRVRPGILILVYHRITQLERDPYRLCVTPRHFAEHLEVLQKQHLVISLKDVVNARRSGTVPRRAVVLTFDDGYADNLENASPLLRQYGAPATLFVVSGSIGNEREFWWDELDRILLQPGKLPDELNLKVGGTDRRWSLGSASAFSAGDAARFAAWHLYQKDDPHPRFALFRTMQSLLRSVPGDERWRLLDGLAAWAGVGLAGRVSHRILDREELTKLTEGALVEVGAHTVTHPVLSSLPAFAQRTEIRGSKAMLQEALGGPVTSFAYPHGTRQDYTTESTEIVREEGFACAVSVYFGRVNAWTDLYQLPRVVAEDYDGDEFEKRLNAWLRA